MKNFHIPVSQKYHLCYTKLERLELRSELGSSLISASYLDEQFNSFLIALDSFSVKRAYSPCAAHLPSTMDPMESMVVGAGGGGSTW